MRTLATFSIVIVALLHGGFAWLEMVAWTQDLGMKIFNMTPAQAEASKVLALNQGFYNLMLAAALLSALVYTSRNTVRVLLMLIIAVGIFGALTVSPTIFVVQALPAMVSWGLVRMTAPK